MVHQDKTKFWLEDPSVLINNACSFNPFVNKSMNYNLNAYTRFTIIVITILLIITRDIKYLYSGIFIIVIIILMYYLNKKDNFSSLPAEYLLHEQTLPQRKSDNFSTKKDPNNPLKNTPIPEYDTAPEYSKATKSDWKMNTFIKDKMFQDPSQFIFDTQCRQYYTMPNTSEPNDRTTFANWLYGTENNCKSGSIYMHRTGTPPECQRCTGFDVSVPTNFGNLNSD